MADMKDYNLFGLDKVAYDLWKGAEGEDNRIRLERLHRNLGKAILEDLTKRQRLILTMKYYQGKNVTTIAKELNVSKSTVSRTISRSIDKLFKTLRYSL